MQNEKQSQQSMLPKSTKHTLAFATSLVSHVTSWVTGASTWVISLEASWCWLQTVTELRRSTYTGKVGSMQAGLMKASLAVDQSLNGY